MAAISTRKLMDTDWRTQHLIVLDATANSDQLIIDNSSLSGWVAGSKLAISKLYWTTDSPSAGFKLIFKGTGGTDTIFSFTGNGTWGFTGGQPGLICDHTSSTAVTSDLHLTNATANGSIFIECTKMALNGSGWSG
tara:strand:- start:180 stop:587 length:408 start_codon:yes stop_codon:yes gene_type:complete